MARPVPIGEYESQIPVEEGLRRIIPQQSGASIGPALEDLGGSLQRVAQSEAAQYTTQALSKAQSEWTQHLLDRQQNAQPGAPGFTGAIAKDYDDYVKQAVKGAPNQLAGRFLQQRLTEFGNNLLQKSMVFEANARQSHNEETAKNSIDSAGNELLNDPSVYTQRLAERQSLISTLNLDPQVKDKLNTYATQSLSRYAVMGDINRDPYQAMLKLQDKEPRGYYAALTPEQREQLMDHSDRMLHQRVADAERIHTLAKQQQEEASDNLLKQGIVMSQKGQLTPDWVMSHTSTLQPAALKYLVDEAAGKNVASDLHTYSDLLTRASHGEDVTEDAKGALFAGQLSKEDFTRVSDMGAKDQPNWFKRGDDYIRTALQVSQLEPDPAKSQTLANARNDWFDWKASNPKATDEQAEKAYTGIVNRYQIVKGEQSMLTLPVPDHFVGSRSAPDVQGSKAALFKAFQAGEINKAQFDREAAILQQWAQAVDFAGKRAAAAKAKQQQ